MIKEAYIAGWEAALEKEAGSRSSAAYLLGTLALGGMGAGFSIKDKAEILKDARIDQSHQQTQSLMGPHAPHLMPDALVSQYAPTGTTWKSTHRPYGAEYFPLQRQVTTHPFADPSTTLHEIGHAQQYAPPMRYASYDAGNVNPALKGYFASPHPNAGFSSNYAQEVDAWERAKTMRPINLTEANTALKTYSAFPQRTFSDFKDVVLHSLRRGSKIIK